MERKLVTIQTIKSLQPIEGADLIEHARVMGWDAVVKKGEFQVGDRCVFFEVDSVLPKDQPWAAFMESRKFRVKTLRLKGVLSQGLALPLKSFTNLSDPHVGADVTEQVGVVKYEPPASGLSNNYVGEWPAFLPKTDEIRLQSELGLLTELRDHPYYITTKCDGTSCTLFKFNNEFGVCSRNLQISMDSLAYGDIIKRYDLANTLLEGYAIQGELCGPGIQKNHMGLDGYELFVFDLYNIEQKKYLGWQELIDKATQMRLITVPLLEKGDAFPYELDALLAKAKGKYPLSKRNIEGIVVKPLTPMYSPALRGRLSFKVLNNDYLLKDEE
jgi:RNA ligase (TIGR02306 family)